MLCFIMQGKKGKGSSREVKLQKSWAATNKQTSMLYPCSRTHLVMGEGERKEFPHSDREIIIMSML